MPALIRRAWLTALAATLWRWLLSPWLLVGAALLGLLLLASIWLLPQLPGQMNEEPATAARWMLNTSSTYGIWGNILQTLGLFNVLHSSLLHLLVALLALVGILQLADQVAVLRQFLRLPSLLELPAPAAGVPLPIPPVRPIRRLRIPYAAPPEEFVPKASAALDFTYLHYRHATVAIPDTGNSQLGGNGFQHAPDESRASALQEHRLLGVRHLPALFLRPLSAIGLLITVIAVWLATLFGWQVASPPVAPGAGYRAVEHDLEVVYLAPSDDLGSAAVPQVAVRIGEQTVTYPVPRDRAFSLAGAGVQVRTEMPALWIAATGPEPQLVQPGMTERLTGIGLVFPAPGSEESLLLPDQVAGVRIVRRAAAEDAFIVELYEGDAVQPVWRAELDANGQTVLPLEDGQVELRIVSMPALRVDVRYLPGLWLVWAGLLLALVGSAGYFRRPAYLLAQVAPWPSNRSVVVLQSNLGRELAAFPTTSPTGTLEGTQDNTAPVRREMT